MSYINRKLKNKNNTHEKRNTADRIRPGVFSALAAAFQRFSPFFSAFPRSPVENLRFYIIS